ncbi:MAG: T9SS type A sorting domain-containing protein [Bacteroidetes bacterium]|nr:T9SS type A sorting domain-containing protein [Bacteroidota bacterium]
MNRIFAFLFIFICATSFSQTENFWTKKADFGALKRERAVAFSIFGKGYIATGVDTSETVCNDLWEYDVMLDTWTQKANLPSFVRRDAIGFAIDGKGYVGMGVDSTESFTGIIHSDFWEYNPASNVWTQKASYPGGSGGGVYFATAFCLDHKGYVCGGKVGSATYIDEVWEYKPSTDEWTQRADFPGGVRYQLSSFVIDNLAYVGLGVDYNVYKKDIWEYHPGSDTWIQKSDFAGGERGSACTFTLGERGFVCLGVDGGLKNDLWEYNPFLDSWTSRASYGGSARKCAVAFAVGGRAFVGTGNGYSGKKQTIYEYSPVSILGMEESYSAEEIFVFPNPVSEQFTIENGRNENVIYLLFTLEGKLIRSVELSNNTTNNLDRNGIDSGVYLLVAKDRSGNRVGTKKMIFL